MAAQSFDSRSIISEMNNLTAMAEFENRIITVIEEIRFRRKHYNNNDMKIKELITKCSELDEQLELQKQKNYSQKHEFDKSLKKHQVAHEKKIQQFEDENSLCLNEIQCSRQEIQILRDEYQKIKIEKLNLEEKLSETSSQLVIRESIDKELQKKVCNIAEKVKYIYRDIQDVHDAQSRLVDTVRAAQKCNDDILQKFNQQGCIMQHVEEENKFLQEQLKNCKATLHLDNNCRNCEAKQLEISQMSNELEEAKSDIDRIKKENELIKSFLEEQRKINDADIQNLHKIIENNVNFEIQTKTLKEEIGNLKIEINKKDDSIIDLENQIGSFRSLINKPVKAIEVTENKKENFCLENISVKRNEEPLVLHENIEQCSKENYASENNDSSDDSTQTVLFTGDVP